MSPPPSPPAAAIALLLALSCGGAWLVDRAVPQPYMDEVFHIPQAQRYLAGNVTYWDPKITTPPALYVAGAVAAYVPTRLWPGSAVASLRAVNVLLHAGTLLLLGAWLHPFPSAAAALYLLPPLYFCQFLFYTDVLSTLCVLLTLYLACAAHRYNSPRLLHAAAASAAVAALARQPNIAWAAFSLGAYTLLATRSARDTDAWSWRGVVVRGLPIALRHGAAFVALGVAFAGAVYVNGGVALGDRSHHEVRLHLAQLVYFAAFFAALTPGYAVQWLLHPAARPRGGLWVAAAWPIMAAACLYAGSHAHPFVLADNRHYVFYLWRRLLGHETRRYWLLIPASTVGAITAAACLDGFSLPFRLGFLSCLCASVMTCPLIEFRYFIVPFILLYLLPLLRRPPASPFCRPRPHTINALVALSVNVVTLTLFLRRPFRAPDGSEGRFMW